MKIKSYKDLIIWQKSMELVIEIYKLTEQFPPRETYGLATQMQRAAVSVPSNIAEGYKRNHLPEYLQSLSVSNGSGAELETQIELCKRLPHVSHLNYTKAENLLQEIMKMFTSLVNKLTTKRYALHPKP